MEMELRLSNDSRWLPSIRAFMHTALEGLGLSAESVASIETLVDQVASHTILYAFPNGKEGEITLKIKEVARKLEITISDDGEPQDVQQLEKDAQANASFLPSLNGAISTKTIDELHWTALGPNGKALHLIKWLDQSSLRDGDAQTPARLKEDEPLAPEQEYIIRKAEPGDALHISRLMYRIYGNTYFNEDLYYPDRVAAQHANGKLLSVIAIDAQQSVVGHSALEFNDEGPVAEVGQAAVDPRHRSRGLLDRMKHSLTEEAISLGLAGWYSDSVTVHIYTQKSNATHGGHVCGIELGVSPKNETFAGFSRELSQRVSCVVYFHWLNTPVARTVFVPERHQAMVSEIYANLGCEVVFGKFEPAQQKHGILSINVNPRAHFAAIRVAKLGQDSARCIRNSARELIEMSHVEALSVEMPIADPGTPEACAMLEEHGFGFTGIGPHHTTRGDVLKMEYLVEPLTKDPIALFEPFAEKLVDYALSEQRRVREFI